MSNKYRAGQFAPPKGALIENYPNIDILGFTAGTPTASQAGWEIGAINIDVTNGIWYRNTGTRTSATWTAVSGTTISSATITTLTTSTISGGGSTIAFTDRVTTTDGVSSGTARVVGGLAFSQTTASTAIASTSLETSFDQSYTIPANTLKVGSTVRISYFGIQTTVVGTDTIRLRTYIGGTGGSLLADSVAAAGANNAVFEGRAVAICRTTGTSGTIVGYGSAQQPVAGGSTQVFKNSILNSATCNTTTGQAVVVSVTFNTTNANSVRLDGLIVDIY